MEEFLFSDTEEMSPGLLRASLRLSLLGTPSRRGHRGPHSLGNLGTGRDYQLCSGRVCSMSGKMNSEKQTASQTPVFSVLAGVAPYRGALLGHGARRGQSVVFLAY